MRRVDDMHDGQPKKSEFLEVCGRIAQASQLLAKTVAELHTLEEPKDEKPLSIVKRFRKLTGRQDLPANGLIQTDEERKFVVAEGFKSLHILADRQNLDSELRSFLETDFANNVPRHAFLRTAVAALSSQIKFDLNRKVAAGSLELRVSTQCERPTNSVGPLKTFEQAILQLCSVLNERALGDTERLALEPKAVAWVLEASPFVLTYYAVVMDHFVNTGEFNEDQDRTLCTLLTALNMDTPDSETLTTDFDKDPMEITTGFMNSSRNFTVAKQTDFSQGGTLAGARRRAPQTRS